MSAGKYDLYVEQGATFKRDCIYKDQTGNPINLNGFTFAGQIRRSYSDPTIMLSFTFIVPTQTGSNIGKFTFTLSAVQTASIAVNPAADFLNVPTNYTYDIEVTTGGTVIRLLQGSVFVSPEVTR